MTPYRALILRPGVRRILALLVLRGAGVGVGRTPMTVVAMGAAAAKLLRPRRILQEGLEFHLTGDFARAIDAYTRHLEAVPADPVSMQLLAIALTKEAAVLPATGQKQIKAEADLRTSLALRDRAETLLRSAMQHTVSEGIGFSMGKALHEVLRARADLHEAVEVTRRNRGNELHSDPSDATAALESAMALHRLGKTKEAANRYVEIIGMEKPGLDLTRDFARINLAVLRQENGDVRGAIDEYRSILEKFPESPMVLNNLGQGLISLDENVEGSAMLQKAVALDPLYQDAIGNLGSHWQHEGDLIRARSLYTSALKVRTNDAFTVRLAIMLSPIMTGEEEAVREKEQLVQAVEGVIAHDPPLVITDPAQAVMHVHFYLVYRGGNHRTVQEMIARMYTRIVPGLLHVAQKLRRDATSIGITARPIEGDATLLGGQVRSAEDALRELEGNPARIPRKKGSGGWTAGEAASNMSETAALPHEGPITNSHDSSNSVGSWEEQPSRSSWDDEATNAPMPPLRVGFVSKFFGKEEPHGMLLEGVIRHLPRTHFRLVLCPIDTNLERLSPRLVDAADEVVRLSPKLEAARTLLEASRLDVLVYADMNSELTTHFLGYSRLARVQAVFWGNPITTGNPSIDYFVSADVMEGQNRTVLPDEDEPYTEQVILLGGQGIWYDRPVHLVPGFDDPGVREATKAALRRELRARIGVGEDSVVFMCPQSIFKLKPDFDLVLRDIISAFDNNDIVDNTKAFLVVTEGRRKKWTEIFQRRLQESVPEIASQVKFLPRTSAGREFFRLMASADVILHPFPFGGSKTAADGLAMGVPVVAMEGNALPGRMAFSLYRTIGLEGAGNKGCCVAADRDSYVQLAIRLGRDEQYRRWASDLIDQRSPALWERRRVVLEWAKFLSRAGGRVPPTAEEVGFVPEAGLPLPPPEPFQQPLFDP